MFAAVFPFSKNTGTACGTRDTRRLLLPLESSILVARRRVARGLRAVPSVWTVFQPTVPSY
jgi:hypothetical protein